VNLDLADVSVSGATHVRGCILKIQSATITLLKISPDEYNWV